MRPLHPLPTPNPGPSLQHSTVTIALPIWARFLLVLGMFFVIGLGVLGVAAGIWERDPSLLVLVVVVFGPMTLGWMWLLRNGLRRVVVSPTHVVVKNLLLSSKAQLDSLTSARHDGSLKLGYIDGGRERTLSIRMLLRDHQTRILELVEKRSPALHAARQAALKAGVPYVLKPASDVIWTNLVFGPVVIAMLVALGVAGAVWAVQNGLKHAWSDAAIGLFMGSLGGLFALLFLWILVAKVVWKWEFTASHISILRAVGWKRFAVADLEAMELKNETRYMKGVPRQAWFLEFRFSGDRTLRVEPTENGLPARFSPRDDHRILQDVERRIRPVYFPAPAKTKQKAEKKTAAPTAPAKPNDFGLAPLRDLLAMSINDRAMESETYRDYLVKLPEKDSPALLAAARHYLNGDEAELANTLLMALSDRGNPTCWPLMVEALDHSDPYLRFIGACVVDVAAGERFRVVDRCIQGGHIDYSAIDDRIDGLKRWWRTEGATVQAAALAKFTHKAPASPREQRWNFIRANPTWVMEVAGPVHAPAPGSRLPSHPSGVHVVGGTIRPTNQLETVEAAFELRATDGAIVGVFVHRDGGWQPVPEPWTHATPRFTVAR